MPDVIAARRPLRRPERAVVYGVMGWAVEVAFTGVRAATDRRTRSWRLQGHSYLWMAPIYASTAYLYEPVRDRLLRRRPRWQRGLAYAAGFTAVEYASGVALKRLTGLIPWDYTGHGRLVIQGATRLDYLPLWALLGLTLESVDDELRALPVVRISRHDR